MTSPPLRFAAISVASVVIALAAIAAGMTAIAIIWHMPADAPEFLALTVLFAPLVALAYCVFAYTFVRKRGTRADISVSRYGVILATGGLLLVFSVSVVLPSLSRAREHPPASPCKRHLKAIGLAILTYQYRHDELMPPSLQALVDEGDITDPSVFRCEASGTRKVDVSSVDDSGDWYYARGDNSSGEGLPPMMPIVWAKKTWHEPGHSNVLYTDGHAAWTTAADIEEWAGKYADFYEMVPRFPETIEE